MLTFGSLFAGVGGIDLGFERAGMRCAWQVELDDYGQKVLTARWPTVQRHGDVSTFCAADSPANRYPPPDSDSEMRTPDGYGRSLLGSFACLGPDGSWRKTSGGYCQQMLDGSWEPFCETWPQAGMMRNGIAYRVPPLVPYTSASACSSWPTVTATDATGRTYTYDNGDKSKPRESLCGKARRLPTITARDGRTIKGNVPKPGHQGQPSLAQTLGNPKKGGRLNPMWCEWFMGFPIGWTDAESKHSETACRQSSQSISDG